MNLDSLLYAVIIISINDLSVEEQAFQVISAYKIILNKTLQDAMSSYYRNIQHGL